MKKIYFVFALLSFIFCSSQNELQALPSQDKQMYGVKSAESVLFDFELGSYCGEFYLKIITDDFYLDYNRFSWSIQCTAGKEGTVSDWIYPDDASFADAPYLYRLLRFDSVPIPSCTIIMLYDGAEVCRKEYVILDHGSFM